MASIEELKIERLKKIEALESEGFNAYPSVSKYTKNIKDFLSEFKIQVSNPSLGEGAQRAEGVDSCILVGRVMMSRSFGNLAFAKIFDGTASVQVVFEREKSEESIDYFSKNIDIGDFIQVTGINYITKKGENSLLVSDIKLLSKALLPLPDKHAGLVDEEEKMRKRYLDILLDENKRDLFYKKAKFWKVVRNFLDDKNFLEVETPTLEVTTGGAEARPFKTHHNDYDLDVYMRISVGELWQKRLMAAGFPKTYEIGRAYRNEGSSPNHLQEFTNCEFYMAYANYKDGMEMVKEMYRKVALDVFSKTEFTHNGLTFNLAHEWTYIDYAESIKEKTGIDIKSDKLENEKIEEIKSKLKELNVKWEGENIERLIDTLWKYCRKSIAGPAFLINHPSITSPLAKRREENINTVEKFQIILAGAEVGNGYSELNDPRLQRENFDQQQKMLEGGDEEAMMPDYDFVEMLEHGMPPTCGFGFGDRLFAFLADLPIRETQLFPLVRPIIKKGN